MGPRRTLRYRCLDLDAAVSTLTPPTARDRRVRRRSEVVPSLRLAEAAATPRDVAIAAEVPVALVYNRVSHVVMMATPEDLSDFALGFSLSEGILRDRRELGDLEIEEGSTGIAVNMTIERGRFAMLENRRRNFASYPREEAIAGVADHIEKFWERRMRQQIVTYVAETGGQGLHELALAAIRRLRPVPAARTARA